MNKKNNQNNKREVNIELLRIVAMFMVITLHCLGHGLLLGNQNLSLYNLLFVRILDSLSLIANSLFIIITGYYLVDKKLNIKRILNLWGKTIFYSLLIFLICTLLNKKTQLYESIFPVLSGQYWFISAYIALYFLAPIINILLNKLNQKQFKYLLINLLIMLGIIRILFNNVGIFSGAIMPMFMVYSIGAYIRKFIVIKQNEKYVIKYVLIGIIVTLLYIIINIVLKIQIKNYNEKLYIGLLRISYNIREYNTILSVAMTVLIFMKFKTLKIKSTAISKIIMLISPSVFPIYLIHENINIREVMWLNMGIRNYANSTLLIPYLLFLIVLVFIVCLCIDLIFRVIYKLIKKISLINNFITKIDKMLERINVKINSYIAE